MSTRSSSLLSLNKENKLSENNCILICPICKLIPKIIINELTNEITYICCLSKSKKCKKKIYPLNYFKSNNCLSKNIMNINIKCMNHNKKYIYYCSTCELNLCSDCINSNNIKNNIKNNEHFSHDIIELKTITPTGSNINKKRKILESFKKHLNKANSIFEEYISKIKAIWNKIYFNHNRLIEYKKNIIETYSQLENNYNAINNLNQILNQMKFINKPFDFIKEVILNESAKSIIQKINDIFNIKNYGFSNLDEMNLEEVFEENRNNNLNSSTSTQKQFAIIKTMLSVKMNENNNNRLLKEYLICGLSSGILKVYDTAPKFIFKKNIYLNYNKEGFCCNKEINYISEISNKNYNYRSEDYINNEFINKKNKLYLLICSNDLDIIEISNNFENYSFIQKIGEANCLYDKAEYIFQGENQYILAYSNWLTFLKVYKKNNNNNSYDLLINLNTLEEVCVSFVQSENNPNFIEILCANSIETNDNFNIVFYKIFNNEIFEDNNKEFKIKENNIKRIKVESFINDQDCLVKINVNLAALILGRYINDYLNYENTNEINKSINGILLINLLNKQVITFIESNYCINKIFVVSGGLLLYSSNEKKINILRYYNQHNNFPEIILNEKSNFYFSSDNFDYYIDNLLDNKLRNNIKNNINETTNEDELILVNELNGGIIALAKNQKIRLYK